MCACACVRVACEGERMMLEEALSALPLESERDQIITLNLNPLTDQQWGYRSDLLITNT